MSTADQLRGRTFKMMREVHRVSVRDMAALVGVSPGALVPHRAGHP